MTEIAADDLLFVRQYEFEHYTKNPENRSAGTGFRDMVVSSKYYFKIECAVYAFVLKILYSFIVRCLIGR